ncbi:unnamed protein product [Ranitomeya imitator]|uniref:Uncharacterized protein n=1 Tax=Ranitomeya imitator TaxID=111125 RepID=A0ABN9MHJ7_9NEOB|nr:unnamed protein product [Ranitomeya imitator]
MPIDERQTFQDLLELLEENEPSSHRKRFPYRNKSLRTPSFSLVPTIKIFFELVKRDIMAMPIRVSGPSNLNIEERRALTALQNNKNFTIKEADKGGNVVLWSTQLYETEAKRQLSNVQYYQKLPSDPTSIFLPKYEQLLCRALQRDIISSQEKQYLWVANPVTATFYMLPKIHKDSTRPPGRPIVSSIGSMCERASEYLDFFLQPIASSLPSFIRDSSHFIGMCDQVVLPTNFLLVTCDVESLYSNIGHKDGVEAIAYFLDKKTSMDRGHDSFLLDLTSFSRSPSPLVIPPFWTCEYSHMNNIWRLISSESLRQRMRFWNFPASTLGTQRRNCTLDTDFTIRARELLDRFRHRGYPKRVISTAYQRAKAQDQRSLLSSKRQDKEAQTRFITDFNNNWKQDDIRWADYPRIKEAGPETYFYDTFGSIGPEEGPLLMHPMILFALAAAAWHWLLQAYFSPVEWRDTEELSIRIEEAK